MSRHPYKHYDSPEEKEAKQVTRRKTLHLIKKGEIKRKPCTVCGAEKADAHHMDYTDPYKIKWLCSTHHRMLHLERNVRERAIKMARVMVVDGWTTRETARFLKEHMGITRSHAWVAIQCRDLY